MKRVLYLAENAISPIQGGGIVVYALLRGLPPENLFGFYCYENITPAPEYAERLHPLTMRDGGGAGSSNYFRPQLAQSHGIETIPGKLLRGSRVFAAHLKDRLLHTDADLAMERIDAANYVPEVIFLAGLSFRMLHLARRLAERYSIPVVMLNMDDWMSDQTARSHPLSAYMRGAIAAEMRAIAPHVQVAISNSPHLAAELTRRYGTAHDTVNNACYERSGFRPPQKGKRSSARHYLQRRAKLAFARRDAGAFLLRHRRTCRQASGRTAYFHSLGICADCQPDFDSRQSHLQGFLFQG
jgi:hypothetical protein